MSTEITLSRLSLTVRKEYRYKPKTIFLEFPKGSLAFFLTKCGAHWENEFWNIENFGFLEGSE